MPAFHSALSGCPEEETRCQDEIEASHPSASTFAKSDRSPHDAFLREAQAESKHSTATTDTSKEVKTLAAQQSQLGRSVNRRRPASHALAQFPEQLSRSSQAGPSRFLKLHETASVGHPTTLDRTTSHGSGQEAFPTTRTRPICSATALTTLRKHRRLPLSAADHSRAHSASIPSSISTEAMPPRPNRLHGRFAATEVDWEPSPNSIKSSASATILMASPAPKPRTPTVVAPTTDFGFRQAWKLVISLLAWSWALSLYLASWLRWIAPVLFLLLTISIIALAAGYLGYLSASVIHSILASVCAVPYGQYVLHTVGHGNVCSQHQWSSDPALRSAHPLEYVMRKDAWGFFNTTVNMTSLPSTIHSLRSNHLRPLQAYASIYAGHLDRGDELHEHVNTAVSLVRRLEAPAMSFVIKQKSLMVSTKYIMTGIASDLQKTVDAFEDRSEFIQAAIVAVFNIAPQLDKLTPRHRVLKDLESFVNLTLPRLVDLDDAGIRLAKDLETLEFELHAVDILAKHSIDQLARECPNEKQITEGVMVKAWEWLASSSETPQSCRQKTDQIVALLEKISTQVSWTKLVVAPAMRYVSELRQQVETTRDVLARFEDDQAGSQYMPIRVVIGDIKVFVKEAVDYARVLGVIQRQVEDREEEFRKARIMD